MLLFSPIRLHVVLLFRPGGLVLFLPDIPERMFMAKKKKNKIETVMHEFKEGELHSGSKKGPKVTNPKQAIAIALSEARKSGAKIPKKRKK